MQNRKEYTMNIPYLSRKKNSDKEKINEVNLGILPKFEALITRVTAPHVIGFICEDNYIVK